MGNVFANISYKTSCMDVPQETPYTSDHLTRDSSGACSGYLGVYFTKDSARNILKQSFAEHPLHITMVKNHSDYSFEYKDTVCKELTISYAGSNYALEGRISVGGGFWRDVTRLGTDTHPSGLKDVDDYNLWEISCFMCNDVGETSRFYGFDLTIKEGRIEFLPHLSTARFEKCFIRLHMRYSEYNLVVTMNLMKHGERGYVGLVSRAHCFDYTDEEYEEDNV